MAKRRPDWEILVGDNAVLDHLASRHDGNTNPHPLQETVEELIATLLTEDEQDIFYMRFGMRLPHREIARQLGYKSHMIIQVKIDRIIQKIGAALGQETTTGDL